MAREQPWEQSPGAEYIHGVLTGSIPVCQSIYKAVERAASDHETGPDRGLIYRPEKAQIVIEYGRTFCKHTKGRWAGQFFEHLPWQKFVTGELFGWMMADTGLRRYKFAYLEIPKKSGKSVYLAVLGLYMFQADGEPGPEVYAIASEREQAGIMFGQARAMVVRSQILRQDIVVYAKALTIPSNDGTFKPLPSDPDTIDGLNASCQLIDELHRHKDRDVLDLCEYASQAREQPLTLVITTAGTDLLSVCYEQHEYGLNVLNGIFENERHFAFISTPDKDYDWQDEKEWYKLNPSLGYTVTIESLRETYQSAKARPVAQLAFRRYRLDEWTKSAESLINYDDWKKCPTDLTWQEVEGMPCYMGIDLAIQKDMSALSLVFDLGEYVGILTRYYCPEKSVHDRTINHNLPYEKWVEDGWLIQTPGNVIDFDRIFADIVGSDETAQEKGLVERYEILDSGVDPFRVVQLAVSLTNWGLTVTSVRQGTLSLNHPLEWLVGKIEAHKVRTDGNPIFAWNVRNVVAYKDKGGMMRPDRQTSKEKIDGFVAGTIAVHRLLGSGLADEQDDDDMPMVIHLGR